MRWRGEGEKLDFVYICFVGFALENASIWHDYKAQLIFLKEIPKIKK